MFNEGRDLVSGLFSGGELGQLMNCGLDLLVRFFL